jgi:hypothetical protein
MAMLKDRLTYICNSKQGIMKSVYFFLAGLFCYSTAFTQTWTWVSAPTAGTNAEIRISDVPMDSQLHPCLLYRQWDQISGQ